MTETLFSDTPGERNRVRTKIEDIILSFYTHRMRTAHRGFHMTDLHEHVATAVAVAPASTDRILRMLRRDGKLDYTVVNRRRSLYRFEATNA